MMTKEQFIEALEEAFRAGVAQGQDEATAYEWGSRPDYSREQAFNHLLGDWNSGPIRDILLELDNAVN